MLLLCLLWSKFNSYNVFNAFDHIDHFEFGVVSKTINKFSRLVFLNSHHYAYKWISRKVIARRSDRRSGSRSVLKELGNSIFLLRDQVSSVREFIHLIFFSEQQNIT